MYNYIIAIIMVLICTQASLRAEMGEVRRLREEMVTFVHLR